MAFKIPTSGRTQLSKPTTIRQEQFTPIVPSQNEFNRLTPAGSVVAQTPRRVPTDRQLDSTGQSVIRPAPVGKP